MCQDEKPHSAFYWTACGVWRVCIWVWVGVRNSHAHIGVPYATKRAWARRKEMCTREMRRENVYERRTRVALYVPMRTRDLLVMAQRIYSWTTYFYSLCDVVVQFSRMHVVLFSIILFYLHFLCVCFVGFVSECVFHRLIEVFCVFRLVFLSRRSHRCLWSPSMAVWTSSAVAIALMLLQSLYFLFLFLFRPNTSKALHTRTWERKILRYL